MSCEKELSVRDLSILDLIFDQSKAPVNLEDCQQQPLRDEVSVVDSEEENSEEILKSKKMEIEGVKLTEEAKFDEALKKFNSAVEIAPKRPSPYNNRAQLFRFLEKDELALNDLQKAIDLCDGNSYQFTKCRAHVQRGIIKRKQNDIDSARDDFNESAKLGSQFARQQLVEMNPYAQLCNHMVNQVLSSYQNF